MKFKLFGFNLLTMGVPDIPETHRAHCIRFLRFYYYHLVDTSADGLLSIARPVISSSALTRFIRYIQANSILPTFMNTTKVQTINLVDKIMALGWAVGGI